MDADRRSGPPPALTSAQRLGYMLVLGGAGTVLAAVLAFAPPLYPAYAHPSMLGLSPSGDQQLAGLVMLAEQVVAFSICAAFLLRARSERRQSGSEGMVKPGLRPTSTARVTAVGP